MTRREALGLAWGAGRRRPNIVLVLADDLGWADLGVNGADLHETPQLDRLAREGVQFRQAYAPSPVCSPTRASILTGKHPARLGMTIWHEAAAAPARDRRMLGAASEPNLALGEKTLAECLREAGYGTALVGKWHLGTGGHSPEAQGFDINIGGTHWGAPPSFFAPYRGLFNRELRFVPGLEAAPAGEYLTDRLTEEAIGVMDRFRARRQPFFLYLAHHAPHTPIEAKQELVRKYERKLRAGLRHTNAVYAAMVESLDESVGRIEEYLRAKGLAGNTVIVFSSDNGGYLEGQGGRVTSNEPLRSGKGSLYEGGIRVPLLVKGPGMKPGIVKRPVMLTDLFPTLLEMAGARGPAGVRDGRHLFAGKPREALHWHYPHYYPTTTPVGALREGRWKLLEYFEDGRLELFDLEADEGEREDLAERMGQRARAMRARLEAWRKEVGARMPSRNPAVV
ncbi:MAG: sulfatase [Bryobacter sp.]|nr:sulfatase [Bryobacter sp. CoA8 C33]